MLKERGHTVTVALDGKDALQKIQQQKYDLVLMDADMPKMNGIDATRTIRKLEEASGERVPIVAMTGYVSEAERSRCLQAGMDLCLAKPFSAEDLYQTVEGLTLKPTKTDPALGQQPAPAGSWQATLLARVGGKTKVLASLIRLFLSDGPRKLARIRGSISRGDGKMLASAAHALRGPVVLLFGETEAAAITRNLETMGRCGDLAGAREACDALERNLSHLCRDLEMLLKNDIQSSAGKSRKHPTRHSKGARHGVLRR